MDTENRPRGVLDNLRTAEVDDSEPFDLTCALSAMVEEGVSEIGDFLEEKSMDGEHSFVLEDILRLSPRATCCNDSDCRNRHAHFVVDVHKDNDNMGQSDELETVDVHKDNEGFDKVTSGEDAPPPIGENSE